MDSPPTRPKTRSPPFCGSCASAVDDSSFVAAGKRQAERGGAAEKLTAGETSANGFARQKIELSRHRPLRFVTDRLDRGDLTVLHRQATAHGRLETVRVCDLPRRGQYALKREASSVPFHTGSRFSAKARAPSFWSSLP